MLLNRDSTAPEEDEEESKEEDEELSRFDVCLSISQSKSLDLTQNRGEEYGR